MGGKNSLGFAADAAAVVIAAAIYSAGINMFISPNNIAPGGVTGVAVILSQMFGASIGAAILVINIPLMIAGFLLLNKRTMLLTLLSVAATSLFTDMVLARLPKYGGSGTEGAAAAVFGGVCMGAALGVTYSHEGTSGGTDILAKIVHKYRSDTKIGTIQFLLDGAVIAAGAAVNRDLNVLLYGIAAVFVQGRVIDLLVYGRQESRLVFIFSEKSAQLSEMLLNQHRGATILKGFGAYSKDEREVIVTAVRKSAYAKIKRAIREIDPNAFVVTAAANEVMGNGF